MERRTLLRLLLMLVLALVVLPGDADAQRGGRRGGGKKGKKGSAGAGLLLPRPATPPSDPFENFPVPKAPGTTPSLSGGLLPAPETGEDAALIPGLPELPSFDLEGDRFPWSDPMDPDLEAHYFSVCDHDANGWVSYREARTSLSLTRLGFSQYDDDRDGRIQPEEFGHRYKQVVARSGAFPPPRRSPASEAGATEVEEIDEALLEAIAMFGRFDLDGDQILSTDELPGILSAFKLDTHVTTDLLISATDADETGKIEVGELQVLGDALSIAQKKFLGTTITPTFAQEDEEFSGLGLGPTRLKIVGPTPHFERLDIDGDGFVTTTELGELQHPIQLSVRTSTVVAALDRDGDGRLSRAEFDASLR